MGRTKTVLARGGIALVLLVVWALPNHCGYFKPISAYAAQRLAACAPWLVRPFGPTLALGQSVRRLAPFTAGMRRRHRLERSGRGRTSA